MPKKLIRVKILSLSVFFFFLSPFSSGAEDFSTQEYAAENVKTVRFEKEGWDLTYPYLQLGSDDILTLHFDIIDSYGESLWYSITHCDRDWKESNLFTSDYLEGFEENQINDYLPSFNTRVTYMHYSLDLPNDDIQFLLSGNYLITVWTAAEPDNPILRKRFYVTEETSKAQVTFRKPVKPGTSETYQQSEITISTGSLPVTDPYRQVTLTIMQNGRPDKALKDILPDLAANGSLKFNTISEKTLMPGGNEFRYFDIKTIRQTRQNVRSIEFVNGIYNAFLLPSEDREFKPYFYNDDLNGRSLIAIEESDDPEREADYVMVYFTLPAYYELQGGSVYVSGDFTGWTYGPSNRMTWDAARGCYEISFLLKQGWYNYEYDFVPSGSDSPEGFHFEGSFWETENDYLILTYFRDPTQRYDQLTGITIANTRTVK